MEHTDLKLDYLSEALMALDDSTQVTADHLGTLLPILVQNLQVSHGALMLVCYIRQDLSINVNCWTFALASLDRQTDKETYQNMAVQKPTYSLQLVYI